jgi:hypothetical protein
MSRGTKFPIGRVEPPRAEAANGSELAGISKPKSGRRPIGSSLFPDKLLILLIPTAFFFYRSSRPVVRLRVDMPARFVDPSASADSRQQTEERRLALAYWNCGVTIIQWEYAYGSPLPSKPPLEFRIGGSTSATPGTARGKVNTPDGRTRYWNRFRELWVSPEAWKSSREWSTAWLTDPVYKFADRSETYFKNLWKVE